MLISDVIPATSQQTTTTRRRRFWEALAKGVVPDGWGRGSAHSNSQKVMNALTFHYVISDPHASKLLCDHIEGGGDS